MININIIKNPYGLGSTTINKSTITLEPGLTILTGCNGAGKTTLINNIKEQAENDNIPCHLYDNLTDGKNSFGYLMGGYTDVPGDGVDTAIALCSSSEGEQIKINLGRQSTLFSEFINTGEFKNSRYRLGKVLKGLTNTEFESKSSSNKRILLFDASDSGVSIDAICEFKELFYKVIDAATKNNVEMYIIIAANEYELCRNEKCFDVIHGEYISFKDYEDYREFILNSRKEKEKRIDKRQTLLNNKANREKESYLKIKEKTISNIMEIKNNAINRELTSKEKDKIHKLKSDFHTVVYNKYSIYNPPHEDYELVDTM